MTDAKWIAEIERIIASMPKSQWGSYTYRSLRCLVAEQKSKQKQKKQKKGMNQ